MEQIVKIEERDGKRLVSARDLHGFLEVKSRFNDWIKNRIDQYDLIESTDYTKILVQSIRGQPEKSCISRHKFYRELRIKGYDAYRTRYGSYLVEKIRYY